MITLRLITQITTSFIVVSAAKAFGIRITGLYVNRLQLAVITVRSKTECFRRCLLKRECVSANFWQSAEHGSSVCVLNGATRNETYADVRTAGATFYGRDVSEWMYLELVE